MRFAGETLNMEIDPTSDELPLINTVGYRLAFADEPEDQFVIAMRRLTGDDVIRARPLFRRAQKRDCVNCNIRHSSYESVETAYCNHCKHAGSEIFSWYKRCHSTRRFSYGLLTLNVVSRRMGIGEVGISDNIMSFL